VDLIESCLQITRSLTTEICPPVLYGGNMIAVLNWLRSWAKDKYHLNIQLRTDREQLKIREDLTIMMYRSVQELLFNIAKHARTEDGKIEVACRDNHVEITVSDRGKGFDPSVLQKHSIDTGFGLFAVQERLQNRGCKLDIQSSPGKGSRFTITAPLSDELDLAIPNTSSNRSRIRVVIADDHSVVRQALAALLNLNEDIEVVGEAENGRVALDIVRRLSPDIVLMDIEMPELDGIKATRLVRLEHPHIKVIGLSMHESKDVAKEILDAGASAFLMKNAPSTELLQAIRGVHQL
jgi:CheY-like chemotaxis protein/anti-sigma regulatory factor (Ser/Thr protein kinase)